MSTPITTAASRIGYVTTGVLNYASKSISFAASVGFSTLEQMTSQRIPVSERVYAIEHEEPFNFSVVCSNRDKSI